MFFFLKCHLKKSHFAEIRNGNEANGLTRGASYPVGEVRTQSGVEAAPLVCALLALLNDVAGDDAATVAGRRLPEERDGVLGLVMEVQVEGRAGPLCNTFGFRASEIARLGER